MRKGYVWRLSTIALIFTVAAFGGFSYAQESGQQGQQQAKQEQQEPEQEVRQQFVEEITVTAQKRTEDVQEVPVSISTLMGTDLGVILTGGPDVRAISARAPSLILESSFGRAFPRFYVRGLGNTDFDLNASQPVSMLVDEIVLENPVVKGMPLWDLDRVEVLRGPQGTLFGRNTPAGVVKFETKKPTKELDGSFRVSFGTFNNMDINGGIGGALSDTVSMRFSGLYQSKSDWVDNKHTGEEDALGGHQQWAYRLQFLFEPNDKLSALLNLHGWDIDGTARIFRGNILKHGTNDLVHDYEQDVVYHDGRNQQDISSMGAVLKIDYNFGAATLTSVTGWESLDDMYSRGDIDGGFGCGFCSLPNGPGFIPFASESADGIPSLDQLTQELRIASNGTGQLQWLAGIYYFNEDLFAETFSYNSLAPGNPLDGYAFQSQDATAYALFGSIDYAFNDQWSLRAGLRFSHDEKDFSAERPDPTFNTPTVRPILASTDDDSVTWDLTATYQANDNVNTYARIATGFRAPSIQGRILFCGDFAGGTDPATNCVTTADTEEITSFEVGVKSILAEHRLRLNLAGFVYDVDGQQLTAVGGQYNTATLLNADKTKGYGFEADVEIIGSANFWAGLGLSYNSTEIDDPGLTVAKCGGGCTTLDPVDTAGLVHVNGNSLPFAPEWIFGGSINYQSDPLNRGFFGTLDWYYYSDRSFFLYESEEFHSDGMEIGLRLGYAWNQGKYEVSVFGRNITDEEIVEGGIDFNNLTGMTNEPRLVGIEFGMKL